MGCDKALILLGFTTALVVEGINRIYENAAGIGIILYFLMIIICILTKSGGQTKS